MRLRIKGDSTCLILDILRAYRLIFMTPIGSCRTIYNSLSHNVTIFKPQLENVLWL